MFNSKLKKLSVALLVVVLMLSVFSVSAFAVLEENAEPVADLTVDRVLAATDVAEATEEKEGSISQEFKIAWKSA